MKKSLNLLVLGVIIGGLVLGFSLPSMVAQGKPISAPNKIQAPEIERGVFVDYGYNSPPWYPPTEETDSYRWAPRISWAMLPVEVTVYTGGQPSGLETFSAIKAGFETWDASTNASLYGTITENATFGPRVVLYDGNTVQWATIDGPGGIIGATYYWYYTATKKIVEFDMVLDKDEPWATDGTSTAFDVQNIATHEAGHTLVLQDLRSPRDGALTMHAFTWLGDTLKRTLGIGDILGVEAIYGE